MAWYDAEWFPVLLGGAVVGVPSGLFYRNRTRSEADRNDVEAATVESLAYLDWAKAIKVDNDELRKRVSLAESRVAELEMHASENIVLKAQIQAMRLEVDGLRTLVDHQGKMIEQLTLALAGERGVRALGSPAQSGGQRATDPDE